MRPVGNEAGCAMVSPPRSKPMEGFFMSEAAAATNPEFPPNIEFLGFVGGWNCDLGIDTVEELFYLIRTNDADWLEVVVRYSEKIMRQKFVISASRQGAKREAAARLLIAHVRSQVHYSFPNAPTPRPVV
jgi:hypothetical protein